MKRRRLWLMELIIMRRQTMSKDMNTKKYSRRMVVYDKSNFVYLRARGLLTCFTSKHTSVRDVNLRAQ